MVTAAYRAQFPERVKAQKAAAWIRHREQFIARHRAYLQRKPWASLLAKARIRARESNREFTLTDAWAKERWTGRCELTGIEFILLPGTKRTLHKSASLDRIDSSKGYTPDNCRFILWGINRFRGDGTDTEMLEIARALVERA